MKVFYMIYRIRLLSLAFIVSILIACGGGGGGGGGALIDAAVDTLTQQITGGTISTSIVAI